MVNVIQYTGEFVPLEMASRPLEGVTDIWLRKNPRTSQDDEGNTIHLADEVYIVLPIDEAPTREELEESFDAWFARAAAPETTLQDAIEAINMLSDIIFGGDL